MFNLTKKPSNALPSLQVVITVSAGGRSELTASFSGQITVAQTQALLSLQQWNPTDPLATVTEPPLNRLPLSKELGQC